MRDGRVRLDEDVLLRAVVDQLGGSVAGVHEDLIDVRGHRAVLDDVVQVGVQEVRHPDRAELARVVRLFQRSPRLDVAV